MVIACPIALCGLSGATTITSPILFITFINDLKPGAVIPSSLVIKIKGFFFILCILITKVVIFSRNLSNIFFNKNLVKSNYFKGLFLFNL